MIVCLNGEFVPEEKAVVSVFDRSFLYGDGLFETIRIFRSRPFRWEQHFARLAAGAEFLGLALPRSSPQFGGLIRDLVAANDLPGALLRLSLSRGVGPRGYSPKGADHPFFVMTLHPLSLELLAQPAAWKLATSSIRVSAERKLAHYKTGNMLAQVLARKEAEDGGAQEALLLNTQGTVAEGSSSNVFWLEGDSVGTAPTAAGLLPGVTRSAIMELCPALGLAVREKNITPAELAKTDGVFLSLTSQGIVECVGLDGFTLRRSPVTQKVFAAYQALLERESS